MRALAQNRKSILNGLSGLLTGQGCPQVGAGGEIPPYSGHMRPLLFSQIQKIKKLKFCNLI